MFCVFCRVKGYALGITIWMRGESCPDDCRTGVNFPDFNAVGHVNLGVKGGGYE